MTPTTCGLVRTPRHLVAVVLGPGGEARRAIRAALTDDARYGLVSYLVAADADIVAAEAFIRGEAFAHRALAAGLVTWVAPDALVSAVTRAVAITDPARIAAILARMPRIPLLRAQLRRLTSATEPTQVPLL